MLEVAKRTERALPVARNRISFFLPIFGVALALLGLFVGWSYSRSGSPTLILPYLSGERLLVEPTTVLLGEQNPGTQLEQKIRLVNATHRPVKLLGAQSTCSCVTLDEFPMSIPAGEDQELTLKIHVGRRPGGLEQSVKLFTDYPELKTFQVTVRGTVR